MRAICEERVWSDTTSYSAAMSACEKGKRWELALEFLEECKTWATASTISYNAVISACEKGDQWQHAFALLRTMCKDPHDVITSIVPNWAKMMEMCGDAKWYRLRTSVTTKTEELWKREDLTPGERMLEEEMRCRLGVKK